MTVGNFVILKGNVLGTFPSTWFYFYLGPRSMPTVYNIASRFTIASAAEVDAEAKFPDIRKGMLSPCIQVYKDWR